MRKEIKIAIVLLLFGIIVREAYSGKAFCSPTAIYWNVIVDKNVYPLLYSFWLTLQIVSLACVLITWNRDETKSGK